MKSQIALVGIGLAVAAGVAYAELKPADSAPNITNVSTPDPVASSTPQETASATPTKSATPVKSKAPAKTKSPKIAKPAISKPSISGGGGDDDGEGREHGERGEEDDD